MIGLAVKMSHVSLLMLDTDAARAASLLARMQVIHLIEKPLSDAGLDELPAMAYQKQYNQIQTRMKKIAHYRLQSGHVSDDSNEPVDVSRLLLADEQSRLIWQEISAHEENIRAAREQLHSASQLSASLSRFENLDIDLGLLSRNNAFIRIFIGTLLHRELAQMRRALSLADTVLEVFHQSDEHAYIAVVTRIDNQHDVKEILKAAGFHELTIPPELQSYPQNIREQIKQHQHEAQKTIDAENAAILALLKKHQHMLQDIDRLLYQAAPYAALSGSLSGNGQLVHLQGWVPASRLVEISQGLTEHLHYPFILKDRAPATQEYAQVPSLQQHHRLLQPFQQLVAQFGIPSYGEIDPTRLFAFSYILMFGMMFGDVGHGAIIILAGFIFRKKLQGLFTFAAFAGLSSILFGFLYGSIFGYEEVIAPLWISPMHDPLHMLFLALLWGIGFIVIANLLSIFNLLAIGQTRQAMLSGRGVAGLVFFGGGIYLATGFMQTQTVTATGLTAMLLPLAVVLHYHWQHLDGTLPEKILVTVIEALDSIINNLSGTLSFLRVAAFSLNHVALAAAVFTMAAMMDTYGHWLTVILGNIFIIVLEGGIVAIQCLRLEYYEGFSRFFQGQGKRFSPLKMHSG